MAGGSAGIAVIRGSSVALRHRLSPILLLAARTGPPAHVYATTD